MKAPSPRYLSPTSKRPLRITVFGAESTGKTTLSRHLAAKINATWLYEFARPYLELTGAPITPDSMTAIWHGQAVLQSMAPGDLVVQDTDLFSTVGYWEFPHWQPVLGTCPKQLIADATRLKSDLYIITPSTIPFEPDPIRYGGDKREGSDEYWISVCERYRLPYVVLSSTSKEARLAEALERIKQRSAPCVE